MIIMKKLLLLGFTLIALSSTAQYATIAYSTAAPLGEFKDYISKYSWTGVEASYKHKVGESFTVGLHYSYTKFYEKHDRSTYIFDNGAITGTRYAYSFRNNIELSLNYMYETFSRFTPYVGFAAGPSYTHNVDVIGLLEVNDYFPWSFSMTPQIGTMIEISSGLAIDVKMNYNYIFLRNDKVPNLQSLGMQLGLTWSPLFE